MVAVEIGVIVDSGVTDVKEGVVINGVTVSVVDTGLQLTMNEIIINTHRDKEMD
jgi:hypothetical protein